MREVAPRPRDVAFAAVVRPDGIGRAGTGRMSNNNGGWKATLEKR